MPKKPRQLTDEEQKERDRRFTWMPGDVIWHPADSEPPPEQEQIPPPRRRR